MYPDKVMDRTACSPTLRLRDLLRLGNNPTIFRNLKLRLYRIAEKHLTLEHVNRDQGERWDAVESELIETFPDIFQGSETHVQQVACQMIKSYHIRRRFGSKQQTQSGALSSRKSNFVMSVTVPTRAVLEKEREAAKNQKENGIIDFTLDDDAKHDEKQKSKVEIAEPKLPLMMDISNQLPGPSTVKRPSRSTSPLKFNSSQRLSTLGSSAARLNIQNTPLHAESSSQARPSNSASFTQGNNEDVFKLTGVTRVARFLNACSPPMAHFLQPFIDFGCTSEEYLVAVSTWPTEKISYFLRQVVSRGEDKCNFSQMDMLILQNHFTSYFNKAQT